MKNVITVVSGLPRSGTSMMMKMLQSGGMELIVDHIRKADDDNPNGYYEFEKVKKIAEDASWLDEAEGKAIKVISMLLLDLPSDRPYKIIFMEREMAEVLASQQKMLERRGEKKGDISDDEMAELFNKHLIKVKNRISRQNNMDILYVKYNNIIDCPREKAAEINQFLGNCLDSEKMAEAVDTSLYRQKNK
jgi:hypothetical protein